MCENKAIVAYKGSCECGETTFACKGEPLFTQYCHCNKCREVANLSDSEKDKVGYAWTAAYLTENFQITSSNMLKEITKNTAKLCLCPSCNSLIYGISVDPAKQGGIGVNANNFIFTYGIPESFEPVRHVWYENHQISFDDNLPKFKDAPKDQGGSGVVFEVTRNMNPFK